jgi:hypothetical protein
MTTTDSVLERTALPPLRLDHLARMTDDTGMLQHAFYTTPDPNHGYTTDDNARALIVALQEHAVTGGAQGLDLAWRYLAFLRYAQTVDGRLHNFLAYDRSWLDEVGSQDCQGRTAWGLGYAVANAPLPAMRRAAEELLDRLMPHVPGLKAPRALAYSALGLGWALQAGWRTDRMTDLLQGVGDRLLARWDATATDDWPWFEDIVAYSSPKLCEGLLHCYVATGEERYGEVALRGMAFMLQEYFTNGMLDLVGQNGWHRRGRARALFDQQPVDAKAVIHACMAAHQVTGEPLYRERALAALTWFTGNNRLGQPVCDPRSGGCFDGLHPNRVNENQGAESTVAYLLSRLAFEMPVLPNRGPTLSVPDAVERRT